MLLRIPSIESATASHPGYTAYRFTGSRGHLVRGHEIYVIQVLEDNSPVIATCRYGSVRFRIP